MNQAEIIAIGQRVMRENWAGMPDARAYMRHAAKVEAMRAGRSMQDVAKEVRAALKQKFTGTTFSVRSQVYAGGSHISVSWQNGPTSERVEKAIRRYQRLYCVTIAHSVR